MLEMSPTDEELSLLQIAGLSGRRGNLSTMVIAAPCSQSVVIGECGDEVSSECEPAYKDESLKGFCSRCVGGGGRSPLMTRCASCCELCSEETLTGVAENCKSAQSYQRDDLQAVNASETDAAVELAISRLSFACGFATAVSRELVLDFEVGARAPGTLVSVSECCYKKAWDENPIDGPEKGIIAITSCAAVKLIVVIAACCKGLLLVGCVLCMKLSYPVVFAAISVCRLALGLWYVAVPVVSVLGYVTCYFENTFLDGSDCPGLTTTTTSKWWTNSLLPRGSVEGSTEYALGL